MSNMYEEKISDIFAEFISGEKVDESIKDLYQILPYATQDQQKIITLYKTLAVKYNSPVLREMAVNIELLAKDNRKLGWQFTRLIEAFSLYKHFKGYKASSSTSDVNANA